MEKKILLSICIPTFNRGELCQALVQECLSIASDEIEVVVSDNHSTDGTEQLMKAIDDDRFHYFRNDENVGWDNIGRALLNGHGKFCMLLRDKDSFPNIAEWFEQTKEILRQAEETSLFWGILLAPDGKLMAAPTAAVFRRNTPEIYINVLNMHTYSTALIFPRKVLSSVHDDAKNSAPYYWSLYPHISLMLHCAKYGERIPLGNFIVRMRETKVFADVKGWDGTSSEPYWTVESRKKQHLDFVRLLKPLNLPPQILIPVLINLIDRQFRWFMAAFDVIHSNIVQKRLDIIKRDREKPVTYWHYIFWDGYASITREIVSLFDVSLIDANTMGIAFNYYTRLLNLTSAKEAGAYKNL